MNELKFNSQVCTTKEQSQHLLELGLKPDTADCYNREEDYCYSNWIGKPSLHSDVPAWSLHRLIDLYSDVEDTSSLCIKNVSYKLLIFCIEKAIYCGFFNKEYLKQ